MRLKKLLPILLIFILGFFFWQAKKSSSSVWDGSSRINLVIASGEVIVASLEPEKNLTLLKLPKNLYLDIPHGLGKYQLGSVYELGKLEKRGGKLLRETIQDYLGVPTDGHIRTSIINHQSSTIKKYILNCLVLSTLSRGETNFSKWDLIRLWWEIKKLRSDKVKFIDLEETNILLQAELPDGSLIWETEFFRLDELVKKYFSDQKIEKEGIEIEILNATEHLGLANKVSRLIANMGGGVVAIGNSEEKNETSKIKFRDETLKKSYTLKKLEKILQVKAEIGEMAESRADLLILIGEAYWERLTKP